MIFKQIKGQYYVFSKNMVFSYKMSEFKNITEIIKAAKKYFNEIEASPDVREKPE